MNKKTSALFLILMSLLLFTGYQYELLNRQYSHLASQYDALNGEYNGLLLNNSRTRPMNEPLLIWGVPQTIPSNKYVVWELPDTFVNHIQVRTNATARFLIMDIFEFVRFVNNEPFAADYDSSGTYFSAEVHLAQGCGVYVFVVVNPHPSPTVVTPNVSATYSPTPFLTGKCTSS